MITQHLCPFCNSTLVCQVSHGHPYWFCIHCHQEVPYAFCDNSKISELIQEISHYQTNLKTGIDDLTKLANYGHFSEYLHQEWKRMCRDQNYLSLIICEVFFSNQNGNSENKLLQKIATIMKNSVHRPGDLIARYRHREFAILLPNTNFEGAEIVTERIRLSLFDCFLDNEQEISNENTAFKFGIASLIPPLNMTADLLIIKTEQALAKAIF